MLSVSGMLLLAVTALPGHAQPLSDPVPCSPEVQVLASAALGHIAEARDLPDFGLVAADRPILVGNFVSGLNCALQDEALPTPSELPLHLVTPGQLQSAANTRGRVQYVEISDARRIDEIQAVVVVGVGMLLPEDSDQRLECCCSGEAAFKDVESTWVFVQWRAVVCS